MDFTAMLAMIQNVWKASSLALALLLIGNPRALAGFSSIYVFGDGVSNTNVPPVSGGAP